MTSGQHRAATNYMHKVSEMMVADFYIQISGKEPLINSEAVKTVILECFATDFEFGTNIITEIDDLVQVMERFNIKVMFDDNMNALFI